MLIIMLFEIIFFALLLIFVLCHKSITIKDQNTLKNNSIESDHRFIFPECVISDLGTHDYRYQDSLQIDTVYKVLNSIFSDPSISSKYVAVGLYNKKNGNYRKLNISYLLNLLEISSIPLNFYIRIFFIYCDQHLINDDDNKASLINLLFEHSVVHGDNLHISQWLIDSGAVIDQHSDYGGMNTLLYVARDNPNIEMLKLLKANGTSFLSCSKYGSSALQFAAMSNPNPDIISFLICQGLSITAIDDCGRNLCMLAAKSNTVPVLKRIILHGCNVRAINDSWNCLFYAVSNNQNIEMIRFLLSKLPHSYINATDNRHRTPLMYALEYCEDVSIARLLMRKGADPKIVGRNGWSSLHWALKYDLHNYVLLDEILSKNVFSTSYIEPIYNLTLFEFACRNSSMPETIDVLISHKIYPRDKALCLALANSRQKSLAFLNKIQETRDSS